jgi:hypothetical protein
MQQSPITALDRLARAHTLRFDTMPSRPSLQAWANWACKLILAHADVFAISRPLELALFMDAKLDVSKGA